MNNKKFLSAVAKKKKYQSIIQYFKKKKLLAKLCTYSEFLMDFMLIIKNI